MSVVETANEWLIVVDVCLRSFRVLSAAGVSRRGMVPRERV